MSIRTDLAVEFMADKVDSDKNIVVHTYDLDEVKVTNVEVLSEKAAKELGKAVGKYVTLETDTLMNVFESSELRELIIAELRGLIGKIEGDILVVGLGNKSVTPDALGPKTTEKILATRHIDEELAEKIGLKGLNSVSVLSPGVLGQTGIETKEIIEGAIERTGAKYLILIDALAARDVTRIGKTVQLSNTGIIPGSGVGNDRAELTKKTLGVKCVTIGVPTVVDAATLCYDIAGVENQEHEPLMVTPRDIDRLIDRSSQIISMSINLAIQPDIDEGLILSLV